VVVPKKGGERGFPLADRFDVLEILQAVRQELPNRVQDPRTEEEIKLAQLARVDNVEELEGMTFSQVVGRTTVDIPRIEGMRVRLMRKDCSHWERGVVPHSSCKPNTFIFVSAVTGDRETLRWDEIREVVNEFEFTAGKTSVRLRSVEDLLVSKGDEVRTQAMEYARQQFDALQELVNRKSDEILRETARMIRTGLNEMRSGAQDELKQCKRDVNRLGGCYRHLLQERTTPTSGGKRRGNSRNPAKEVVRQKGGGNSLKKKSSSKKSSSKKASSKAVKKKG
jgi:hypothetical protein